jgi:ABC-type phosphate transport system substrate-binding protein
MKTLAYPLLLVAAAAALAGCGGGDPAPAAPSSSAPAVPAAAAAAEPTSPGVPCGDVSGTGGAKTTVVAHGQVDCAAATKLLKDYFAKLTPAETNSPDGPGPIVLDEWTCGSGAGDPVTACSTEDGRQIEGTRA